MALTIKNLGIGKVPNVTTHSMYTVGSTKCAIVSGVYLNNVDTVGIGVRLQVNIGGTSVRIYPDTTIAASGFLTFSEKVTLGAGDKIDISHPTGGTFTADKIIYQLSGFERDV